MHASIQTPHERLDAYSVQLDLGRVLVTGAQAAGLAGVGQGAFSPVVLRYACPRFETRQPFFPALAADDWGNRFQGLEAIDWLAAYGLRYPRADVVGIWSDGSQDQLFVKELDLAIPMSVYAAVSSSPADFPGQPLRAAVEVVAAGDFVVAPGGNLPARLSSALPVFQLQARWVSPDTPILLAAALDGPRRIGFGEAERLLSRPPAV
jgi:hypothetical protein